MDYKKLGIYLAPAPRGGDGGHVASPLGSAHARGLREAFLADLLLRLSKLKKVSLAVLHDGSDPGPAPAPVARGVSFTALGGHPPGDRLGEAFRLLHGAGGRAACVVGSESPDLPLVYVKRTYVKLKHRDIVLGPTLGGGLYLIGSKKHTPGLFDGLAWGGPGLFAEVLRRVEAAGLACALLPPWYEVNSPDSLAFLETMLRGRRVEGRDRLPAVERALESMRKRPEKREG